ncbi:glycosyl hydrolase 53 family protein, partial [Liquorilactobacillus ghanensis]|uniref:glycosyl hydrolase 53 family protein n=1 Tax=Liquorilactobacillus ghanensis TaxID=399370 RepID=UPI0039E94583
QKINNHWYLFNNVTGAMQTGFQFINNQNKLVYYDPTGKMLYGQQIIHGKRYNLNKVTGALNVNPGQNLIDGHWYLFDSQGKMRTGLQQIPAQHKTVYYANNGQMQYGQQKINNYWYLFDDVTGAMKTGIVTLSKKKTADGPKTVYYANNGQMQYGQQKINNHWYFFKEVTGAMQVGFVNLTQKENSAGPKTVYYNPQGQMQYGQQRINNYWYLFDDNNGAMKTGFQKIPSQNKTVYYNPQGQMQYSWQKIDNDQYYFNPTTGAMTTGQAAIDGTTFDFSSDGKLESLMAFRNLLAQQINENLDYKLNADWQSDQDNYLAFALHDAAQLVAQGDLDATAAAIEKNLLENDNLTGTVAVYTADVEGTDVQKAAASGTATFMDWYQNQLKDTDWTALGTGGILDLANPNSWVASYILYRPGQDTTSQATTATSTPAYQVTATYKDAGVVNDVTNPLQANQSVAATDLNLTTVIPEKLLQGTTNSEFSQTDLQNIYQTLPGSTTAIEGTKTYYDSQGNPYHYQFWLAGQSATDKENNFVNLNTGKKYGDQLLVQLTATLVWGKPVVAVSVNAATEIPTSSMTADQIAAAYENGTDTGLRYEGVTVKPIAGMTDDTIRGVDVSSYTALQAAGVQFYDFNGKPADLIQVLHEAGVNYLRLRLWVDPYNATNQTYGGGASDEYSELQMAKEAAKYGMKVLLDFQYSDFWTDPATQIIPKAWKNENSTELEESMYLYTRKIMQDFKNTGVQIGMAQIGNEITKGFFGINGQNVWNNQSSAKQISNYLNSASKAIKEISPTTLVAVHFESPNVTNYSNIMQVLQNNNVMYDVLGSSYYPFWGSENNPQNIVNIEKMALDKYNKKFVILETSWLNSINDADGTTNNIGSNQAAYSTGVQGQVDELEALYKGVLSQSNGLGAFYWEPAWIPVKAGWNNWQYNKEMSGLYGTGWASANSKGYYPDSKLYYNGNPAWGGSSWDNMALFDDLGYPLQSLNVYNGMLNGYQTPTTSTSTINLQVDSVYNQGVELQSGNLKVGDILTTNNSDLPSGISDSLLTGKWQSSIGTAQLDKIAAQLNGNSTALVDSKTYYSTDGQAYHYEFWLSEGGTQDQKAWNFTNDNQNALYGAPLTAHVSATLVWGPAKEESI